MSESDIVQARREAKEAHARLDEHEEVHDHHDRRISRNENWRLQAQGALKFAAVALGAGGLGLLVDILII